MNEVVEQPTTMQVLARYDENGMTEKQSYQPSRQECLRDYEVRLRFLTLGCVIEVGCKSIPFTTIKQGMEALNEYIAKPWETRQIWEKRFQEGEK